MDINANSSNELVFTDGALTLSSGALAITQHLRIRLRFFKGENFLNPSEGVPYFDRVLIKSPSIPLVTALFKRIVRDTPGIVEILTFAVAYDPATRKLSLTFAARCSTGETLDFGDFVINE